MFVLATTAVVIAVQEPSRADQAAPVPFVPDSSLRRVDTTPPGPPLIRVLGASRGHGAVPVGNDSYVDDSEGDYASIAIEVFDKLTRNPGQCSLGYRSYFVDGNLPDRLPELPRGAWCPLGWHQGNGIMVIGWIESRGWDQDPFCFRMYVTAIDSAGNESAPSNIVNIWHDGNQDVERARMTIRMDELAGRGAALRQIMGQWSGIDQAGHHMRLRMDHDYFDLVASDSMSGAFAIEFVSVPQGLGLIDFSPFDQSNGCSSLHGTFQRRDDTLSICVGGPGASRPNSIDASGPGIVTYTLKRVKSTQ